MEGVYGAMAMAWDACSKMNGLPLMSIRAGDPIEEMERMADRK